MFRKQHYAEEKGKEFTCFGVNSYFDNCFDVFFALIFNNFDILMFLKISQPANVSPLVVPIEDLLDG